jgi:hypothetical protein
MRSSLLASVSFAILVAGCGSPTGPGTSALQVDRASIVLQAIGDSSGVTATLGAQSTRTPAFSVASEARLLPEAAVLDAQALARGVVRATAPGSAVLSVAAFGGAPARVSVEVKPLRPVVLSVNEGAVGDGDTLRLRGYGMAGLGQVSVGGTPARVLGGDAITLLVAVPSLRTSDCSAGTLRQPLQVQGADVAAGIEVARRAEDEVKLAPGQLLQLTPRAAHCLRLAPEPGARYALAFLDTRQLARARAGFEGRMSGPARYTVTVAEAGSARAMQPNAVPSHSTDASEPASTTRDARLFSRTTPWAVGERFETTDGDAPVMARVAAVHGGLVLAVAEGQAAEGGTEAWLARGDTALRFFAASGYGIYRRALTPNAPTTSDGSGQLLVLAMRQRGAYSGFNEARETAGAMHSVVHLNLAVAPLTAAGMLRVLSHEVAHAWQAQYGADTRPAGAADARTGAQWSIEGTADLLAWWMLGRFHGIDPDANWDWAKGMAQPATVPYALLASSAGDDFASGYASAASFCLDLATRMVRRGASWEAAIAAVVRGSLDGWHGYAVSGARREGLAARVRPVLGEGWSPEDALLTWTLSQAVDDASANEVFQNRAFLRAHTGPGVLQGWGAPAVLNTGATATRVDVGAAAQVWGNAASVSPVYGSTSYVLIDDHGRGGAYSLTAAWNGAPFADVAWALLRYQ